MFVKSRALKKWFEEGLLYRSVVSADDVGDNIEGVKGRIYTPGFCLDNGFSVYIDNNTILHGINKYRDLVGLKLIDIKIDIKNKLIKFFFENNKSIDIGMAENGFNGPEAKRVKKNIQVMVKRKKKKIFHVHRRLFIRKGDIWGRAGFRKKRRKRQRGGA
jgi:hypothetical protein